MPKNVTTTKPIKKLKEGDIMPPVPPGQVLKHQFMEPLALSINELARSIDVPPNRISAIVRPQNPRAITVDTAIRLAAYFETTVAVWLGMQEDYEIRLAEYTGEHSRITKTVIKLKRAEAAKKLKRQPKAV